MSTNATRSDNEAREYQWSLYRAELAREDERYRRECERDAMEHLAAKKEWRDFCRWSLFVVLGMAASAILLAWLLTFI